MKARSGRLAAIFLPVVAGLAMLAWTWGKWPDVLVDFGRELYVPWRIVEGDRLHAELAWFNGPLSPYLNATWFRLFGVGLWTLVGANLALLAVLATLAWRGLDREGGSWAACAGTVTLLVAFAFAHLTGIGNYNFVTPYSHELTHGLLAAAIALATLIRFRDTGRRALLPLAGLALGLVFLTKAEVFLAAAAGATCLLLPPRESGPGVAVRVGLFALGAAAAVGVAFAGLAASLPAASAWSGVLGTWPALVAGDTAQLDFYRGLLGIDEPGANLLALVGWSVVHAALFGLLATADRRFGPHGIGRATGPAAFVVAAALALVGLEVVPWLDVLRPLPLAMLGVAIVSARGWRRARATATDAPEESPATERISPRAAEERATWRALQADPERALRGLAWAVFGGLLLAKIALATRPSHYGFALALPATLVYVGWLVGRVPAWLRVHGGGGELFRWAVLGILAATLFGLSRHTALQLSRKTYALGTGVDRMWTDPYRGPAVERALERVEELAGPAATFAALPEGIALNFLARRRNPTPYPNYMPPELAIFCEQEIVAALDREPPDLILLVHKDTSEYGLPFFGTDYGLAIARWIVERYQVVHAIGDPPLQPKTLFGIHILKRP